jgi:hypothetical protein
MLVTFDRSRIVRVVSGALLGLLLCASAGHAQLLDFPPPTHPSLLPAGSWTYALPFIEMTKRDVGGGDHPEWVQGKTTYDGQYLTIQGFPQWITFPGAPFWYQAVSVGQASDEPLSSAPCGVPTEGGVVPQPIECGNFTAKVRVDSYTGAMVGGTNTDLMFRGHVILSHFACADGSLVYPNCNGGAFGEVIDLDANGTLLTGKVVEMGSQYVDATTARFNFRVSITGGLLAGAALGTNKFDSNAFDLGIDVTSANFTGTFAAGAFNGAAKGVAGGIQKVAGLAQCTGLVNGRVWNDINRNNLLDAGETGLPGAAVTLTKTGLPVKSTTSDANGIYAFPYVCGGDNQVDVTPPTGFTSATPASRIVTVPTGGIVSGVDFAFFAVPTGNYATYNQAAWGAKPKNGNAAQLLADNFDTMYTTGEIVIGIADTVGRYSITMTGAPVIQTFLPQGGPAAALTKSYVDPISLWKPKHAGKFGHHKMISQLAGNVMALQLNVDFSNKAITRFGLSSLKVVSGTLAGQTVAQVLALANRVLGGDPVPAGLTLQSINDVVKNINSNYEAGAVNRGFLQ